VVKIILTFDDYSATIKRDDASSRDVAFTRSCSLAEVAKASELMTTTTQISVSITSRAVFVS